MLTFLLAQLFSLKQLFSNLQLWNYAHKSKEVNSIGFGVTKFTSDVQVVNFIVFVGYSFRFKLSFHLSLKNAVKQCEISQENCFCQLFFTHNCTVDNIYCWLYINLYVQHWHLYSQMHVFTNHLYLWLTIIGIMDTKLHLQSRVLSYHSTMYGNVKDNFVYLFVTNADH